MCQIVISQVVVSGYSMCQAGNGEGGYGGLCVRQSVNHINPLSSLFALIHHIIIVTKLNENNEINHNEVVLRLHSYILHFPP